MKKSSIIIGLLLLIVIVGYLYIYKSHRNIGEETVRFNVSSEGLFAEFMTNETAANSKYLNKTILVSGKVSAARPIFSAVTSRWPWPPGPSIRIKFGDANEALP